MTELSQKIAAKLKATNDAQAIKDAKFVEEQRIKRANGNGIWLEVREAIVSECKDLNNDMEETIAIVEQKRSHEIEVRAIFRGKPRKLHLEYSKERLQLVWTCGDDRKGYYPIATMENGRATFVHGELDEPITPQEVGETLVKILFGLS